MATPATSGELDLGIMPEQEKLKSDCCPSVCDSMDQPRYPELTFRGPHADLFREKYGSCAPGDEYEATFRLRVKSSSDGEEEYDKRIEFCVVSIIGDVVEEEPAKEDAAKEENTEKSAKPKRMVKKQTTVANAY